MHHQFWMDVANIAIFSVGTYVISMTLSLMIWPSIWLGRATSRDRKMLIMAFLLAELQVFATLSWDINRVGVQIPLWARILFTILHSALAVAALSRLQRPSKKNTLQNEKRLEKLCPPIIRLIRKKADVA